MVLRCSKSESSEQSAKPAVAPVKVDTAPIVERSVPRIVPLTGTLAAELRTELTANATGRVVKTSVERGQKVEQGALLAQLDIRSAAANAAEAEPASRRQDQWMRRAPMRAIRARARGAIPEETRDKRRADTKRRVAVSQARASTREPRTGTIRGHARRARTTLVGRLRAAMSQVVTLWSATLRLRLTVGGESVGERGRVERSRRRAPGHLFRHRQVHEREGADDA